MITTVTLNPCADRSVSVKKFTYGGLNRVIDKRVDVSGKGINVSIALKQLGEDTKCVTFNHQEGGSFLLGELRKQGIPYEAVEVAGTLRTNVKIYDLENQVFTELNEGGGWVEAEAIRLLLDNISNDPDIGVLVLSGSVPPGIPRDIYRQIIEKTRDRGDKIILDAEGELLTEGLRAKPYLIKPNLFELETVLGTKLITHEEVINAAQHIVDNGVEVVCVSMADQGALVVSKNECYFAPALKLAVKGIQGAGDSMVAGFGLAIRRELPLAEMLRHAVAAASASLIREGTLMCTKEDFERMLQQVTIEGKPSTNTAKL